MALNTLDTQYNEYVVKNNDTIHSIAKENNTTVSKIIEYNNLSELKLKVGMVLKVSIKTKEQPEVARTPTTTDDNLEENASNAAAQNTNAELEEQTVTQLKENYKKYGSLDYITNELNYLSDKGYTPENLSLILNSANAEKPTNSKQIEDYLIKMNSGNNSSIGTKEGTEVYKNQFNVLGMPFRFNILADPKRRIYSSTYLADGPIVSLMPGLPKFRKNDSEIKKVLDKNDTFFNSSSGSSAKSGEDAFLKNPNFINGDYKDDSAIHNWLLESQKNNSINTNKDLRYYHLEPNHEEFLKYFQLLMNVVGTKMHATDFLNLAENNTFGFSDLIKTLIPGGNNMKFARSLRFYCTKSISLSESISNDFGPSTVASAAKGLSDMAKEFMFLTGKELTPTAENGSTDYKDVGTSENNIISSIVGSVGELFNLDASKGTLGEIYSGIHQSTSGVNLVYPDIWKDSSFSKDIGLTFEFASPYGSAEAIWKYVYTPFIVLLTLAAPHQVGTNGYTSPFICKVDIPGLLTSDLAAITNMSWTKGGNENLFNRDGLPIAMSVSINIKDLSPALTICKEFEMLRHNTGLHGFLDNMAGLALERFTPISDFMTEVQGKTAYMLGGINRKVEGTMDKFFNTINRNIFKTNP